MYLGTDLYNVIYYTAARIILSKNPFFFGGEFRKKHQLKRRRVFANHRYK